MPFAFIALCIQARISCFYQDRFPHSEISGSKLDWQLPEAYGSLPPPSSPLDTKASTKSPLKLTINLIEFRLGIYSTNISKITRIFYLTTHHTLEKLWWRWAESNRWPSACKADALPTELHPPGKKHPWYPTKEVAVLAPTNPRYYHPPT